MRDCIFGVLALTGLVAWTFASPTDHRVEPRGLRPSVAWSGPFSAVGKPRYVRVTSAPEWMTLWREHVGNSATPTASDALRPGINFDEYMVVGIFTGNQLSRGGVFLVSIADEGELIRLRFEHMLAATRDQQEVTPFGIFVLPRSAKPLILEGNVSPLGKQAVWEERQRLPGLRGK